MCIVGVAFLIGIAMIGVGSFTLCVLESYHGLAGLAATALRLGIAIWLLVEGVVEHNSSGLAAATFMFSIAGFLGLLTFVFHWEHLWSSRSQTSTAVSDHQAGAHGGVTIAG